MKKTKFLVQSAFIAALYTALTLVLAPISYGMMQVRVSEILTVLPIFTPAAIPGLFIGCLLSNVIGGFGLMDILFGSLATLLAAGCTYLFRKKPLFALAPPVLCNALIVGWVLYIQLGGAPLYVHMLWVGFGQLIACYGLGVPAYYLLKRYQTKIFR